MKTIRTLGLALILAVFALFIVVLASNTKIEDGTIDTNDDGQSG